MDKQLELMRIIIDKTGINIVTCPQCPAVILVRCNEEEHRCYDCGAEADKSSFPDLFYEVN